MNENKLRGWWWLRERLDGSLRGAPPVEMLERSRRARSVGGVATYLPALLLWLGAAACAPDRPRSGPVEHLLPPELKGMHVGSSVLELRQMAPGVSFTPYDGLGLKLSGDPSGFRAAWFSTGELFAEIPPEPDAEIREIRLEGDSIGADAITRVSRAFGGKAAGVRCVMNRTVEVHVWEDRATRTGAELTLPFDGSGRVELRLFEGRWPGDGLRRSSSTPCATR